VEVKSELGQVVKGPKLNEQAEGALKVHKVENDPEKAQGVMGVGKKAETRAELGTRRGRVRKAVVTTAAETKVKCKYPDLQKKIADSVAADSVSNQKVTSTDRDIPYKKPEAKTEGSPRNDAHVSSKRAFYQS